MFLKSLITMVLNCGTRTHNGNGSKQYAYCSVNRPCSSLCILHANAEDDSDENLKVCIMIYVLSSQYSFTN